MKLLATERLTLRPITEDDAPLILGVMNEPDFIRFVSDRGLRTPADAARYIAEKILPGIQRDGFGMCVVRLKKSGTPIGTCGLFKRQQTDVVEIGFGLLSEFWGKGFAHEAATAIMAYGRDVLKLTKIIGVTHPENVSSIKLLEKLGMRYGSVIVDAASEGAMKLFSWSLEPAEDERVLRPMGHNRGRDNVRKRATRRRKLQRLAGAGSAAKPKKQSKK